MKINFENKITHNQILFKYAKGESIVKGNEIHPYHEILYYMDGGGKILTEHFEEELSKNTLLIIPKNTYHQFLISDQENYTRLVLNFPETIHISDITMLSKQKVEILHPTNTAVKFLVEKMCIALSNENPNQSTLNMLYGAFLMLMSEINMDTKNIHSPKLREDSDLISKCVQYIDTNFASNISVETIAGKMNVSPSTLFQCFKKQLGISIHKYITEKRLIHAHELLQKNKLPTKIYLECGYNDYATFYKAYLKMFGHSPSSDKIK